MGLLRAQDRTGPVGSDPRAKAILLRQGYLKILIERFGLIEKKLPIFAKPGARQGRFYLTDNFLTAWLAALANPIAALQFQPPEKLVQTADERLADVEGPALEKLVAQLYEERGRKGIGDFPLTHRISGYWNSKDTELDFVAVNETDKRIRFGTSKRSDDKLAGDSSIFKGHVARFIAAFSKYRSYSQDLVGFTVRASARTRAILLKSNMLCQDLTDLTTGLK